MGKTINIGGRIHNPEVGNVVTGASEVLDDTKGKKQSVINSEVDVELLRLENEKQDNLSFDNTPTENSTNPVTSGGVYAADALLQQAIEAILALIPSAATTLNQLADKAFVNSTVATNTATFRGTYNVVTDLGLAYNASHQDIATALLSHIATADNNDYAFVQIPVSGTSEDIRVTERYKFNGEAWAYEYDLNNSGFTAAQWAAINSGITALLVTKLGALPTAEELATALAGKQATLTFDNVPTSGSNNPVKSGGLYELFTAINAKFPTDASANNKLVAEDRLAAYVTAIIGALDATYNVTSTDGHVTVKVTQVDGAITNVEVNTSDIASASDLASAVVRISTNEADIAALQAAYAALSQSQPVPIAPTDTWPVANPEEGVIYRVVDRVNTPPQYYTDYMWNGTVMVEMAQYNNAIDPRPIKGSTNLVTSGGVFDNMGALDVSELNASGGTLATYVTLDAALAAIPADYQKGGMSIKFVQTSDNKYVQYRLMSNTFNTTVANWQGVDDEPTAGSDNLVKSGGIYNYIDKQQVKNGQIVDFSNLTLISGTVWYDVAEWGTNQGDGYILCLEGVKHITIVGNAVKSCEIAFLTDSSTPKAGQNIHASSLGCHSIAANQIISFDISSDSKYVFIGNSVGAESRLPQTVSLFYDKDVAEELALALSYKDVDYNVNVQELNNVSVWPYTDILQWASAGDGYILDVQNFKKITFTANANRSTQICCLTSNNTFVPSSAIEFSSAGNINIPATKTFAVEISSDTRFVYIGNVNSGNSYLPSSIVVTKREVNAHRTINIVPNQDITSILQNELNIGGDILIDGNGVALISSTLILKKSNTKLHVSKGVTLKLANNVNAPLIMTENGNLQVLTDAATDALPRISNIEISGGTWDLNSANQTRNSISNEWIKQTAFRLYDIDYLNVHDMLIKNPITFTISTGNINHFTFRNLDILLTNILPNNDGIHFDAACYNGLVENIKGNTNDDLIALNFGGDGDLSDPTDPTSEKIYSNFRSGGAWNIKVQNIFCDHAMRAVRVLCDNTHTFDNIDIDGIYGDCYESGVINISCWKVAPCHIKRLKISNVQCYINATYMGQQGGQNPVIRIADESQQDYSCIVDSLIVDNIQVDQTSEYKQNLISINNSNVVVKNLVLSNVIMTSESLDLSEHRLIYSRDSKIDNLIISNVNINNSSNDVGKKLFGLFDGKSDLILVSNSILNCDHTYYIWNTGCVIKESNVVHNGIEVLANNDYTSSIEYTASR